MRWGAGHGGGPADHGLDPFFAALLTNGGVIGVGQDALGARARRIASSGTTEVWSKDLSGGRMAIDRPVESRRQRRRRRHHPGDPRRGRRTERTQSLDAASAGLGWLPLLLLGGAVFARRRPRARLDARPDLLAFAFDAATTTHRSFC